MEFESLKEYRTVDLHSPLTSFHIKLEIFQNRFILSKVISFILSLETFTFTLDIVRDSDGVKKGRFKRVKKNHFKGL